MSGRLANVAGVLVVVSLALPAAAAEFELGPAYFIEGCQGVLGSWQSGPALVAGMVGSAPGSVRPELRVSWRAAAFDEYGGWDSAHIPEVSFSEYCGDTAAFWRASLGVRFVGEPSGGPYFALRTGIIVAQLGDVERLWWDNTDPAWGIYHARGTGSTDTEAYFAVGIGTVIWGAATHGLALEAEAISVPNLGGVSVQFGAYGVF